jgi:hypothetical protein
MALTRLARLRVTLCALVAHGVARWRTLRRTLEVPVGPEPEPAV